MLLSLSQVELDASVAIRDGGDIEVDRDSIAGLVGRALGTDAIPRIALTKADYAETADGAPVPETRSAAGIWWVPDEEDDAEVGTWSLDGLAFSVTQVGLQDAPVSEDQSLVDRACRAVASGYPDGEVAELGLVRGAVDGNAKDIRVFAVRDPRVNRVEDLLSPDELARYRAGTLGVAVVLDIGGGKALVRKHDC